MENDELLQIRIEIPAGDATREELDRMTRNLLAELRATEVESAELAAGGAAPAGAKAVDPVTAGAIAVAVLPPMLTKIVETLQSWLLRNNNRTVKFEGKVAGQNIKFEGSADDLQKLIESLSKRKSKK